MKNVMVKAWEIAKQGQVKFGGNVKQYFAVALKMAWKDIKINNLIVSTSVEDTHLLVTIKKEGVIGVNYYETKQDYANKKSNPTMFKLSPKSSPTKTYQLRYDNYLIEVHFESTVKMFLINKGELKEIQPRKKAILTIDTHRNHKSWVAQIKGKDAQYGFARKFISATENGKWLLEDGLYDVCDKGSRSYIRVKNGVQEDITKNDVTAAL